MIFYSLFLLPFFLDLVGDLDRRKVGVISVPAVDVLSIEPLKKKGKYQSKYSTMNRQREKDSNSDDTALFAVTASNLLLDFMKPIEVAQQLACSLYYDGGDDERKGMCESRKIQRESIAKVCG